MGKKLLDKTLLLVENSKGAVHVRISPITTEKGIGLEVTPVNGLPILISPGDIFHLILPPGGLQADPKDLAKQDAAEEWLDRQLAEVSDPNS